MSNQRAINERSDYLGDILQRYENERSGRGPEVTSTFFAGDPTSRAGARVAVVDADGDGKAEVVAAPGAGTRPVVSIYDPITGSRRDEFYGFPVDFLGGVSVG